MPDGKRHPEVRNSFLDIPTPDISSMLRFSFILNIYPSKVTSHGNSPVVFTVAPAFSNSANSDLRILGQDTPVHVLLFYHTSREVVNSICKKAGKRNKLHKFSRRFLSKKRTTSKISTAFFRQNRMPLPTLPLYPIKIYSFRSGKVSGIS